MHANENVPLEHKDTHTLTHMHIYIQADACIFIATAARKRRPWKNSEKFSGRTGSHWNLSIKCGPTCTSEMSANNKLEIKRISCRCFPSVPRLFGSLCVPQVRGERHCPAVVSGCDPRAERCGGAIPDQHRSAVLQRPGIPRRGSCGPSAVQPEAFL